MVSIYEENIKSYSIVIIMCLSHYILSSDIVEHVKFSADIV